MDNIISLRAAKIKGLSFYFTGIPCKHGHICERKVNDRGCVECRRQISRDYGKRERERDPEINRTRCRKRYVENRQEYIDRARKWESEHPERFAELQRKWRRTEKGKAQFRNSYAENPEKHNEFVMRWKQAHPHLVAEYTGTRRAAKLNATPPWLSPEDRADIRVFYKEAKRLEKETGLKHHVLKLSDSGLIDGLFIPRRHKRRNNKVEQQWARWFNEYCEANDIDRDEAFRRIMETAMASMPVPIAPAAEREEEDAAA